MTGKINAVLFDDWLTCLLSEEFIYASSFTIQPLRVMNIYEISKVNKKGNTQS